MRTPVLVTINLGGNPHAAIAAAMDSRRHGIWYWARDAGYVKSRRAWFVREDLSDGGTLKLGPRRYIYKEDVARGCRVMAEKFPKLFARMLDEMQIDAPLGDLLLQLIVFGEEKYA